jgi:hypothetical protein
MAMHDQVLATYGIRYGDWSAASANAANSYRLIDDLMLQNPVASVALDYRLNELRAAGLRLALDGREIALGDDDGDASVDDHRHDIVSVYRTFVATAFTSIFEYGYVAVCIQPRLGCAVPVVVPRQHYYVLSREEWERAYPREPFDERLLDETHRCVFRNREDEQRWMTRGFGRPLLFVKNLPRAGVPNSPLFNLMRLHRMWWYYQESSLVVAGRCRNPCGFYVQTTPRGDYGVNAAAPAVAVAPGLASQLGMNKREAQALQEFARTVADAGTDGLSYLRQQKRLVAGMNEAVMVPRPADEHMAVTNAHTVRGDPLLFPAGRDASISYLPMARNIDSFTEVLRIFERGMAQRLGVPPGILGQIMEGQRSGQRDELTLIKWQQQINEDVGMMNELLRLVHTCMLPLVTAKQRRRRDVGFDLADARITVTLNAHMILETLLQLVPMMTDEARIQQLARTTQLPETAFRSRLAEDLQLEADVHETEAKAVALRKRPAPAADGAPRKKAKTK